MPDMKITYNQISKLSRIIQILNYAEYLKATSTSPLRQPSDLNTYLCEQTQETMERNAHGQQKMTD